MFVRLSFETDLSVVQVSDKYECRCPIFSSVSFRRDAPLALTVQQVTFALPIDPFVGRSVVKCKPLPRTNDIIPASISDRIRWTTKRGRDLEETMDTRSRKEMNRLIHRKRRNAPRKVARGKSQTKTSETRRRMRVMRMIRYDSSTKRDTYVVGAKRSRKNLKVFSRVTNCRKILN